MSSTETMRVLARLWDTVAGDPSALARVSLTGQGVVLPSSFAVDDIAQASIAAVGLAAAEFHRARGGPPQTVTVDRRHAAAEVRSERYLKVDHPDQSDRPPPQVWDKIAGLYRTGDKRWVRLHTNFAHHRDGILALLGVENEREAVQSALLGWSAEAFETAAANRKLVATMTRTPQEWSVHPQGIAVAGLPLLEIARIGDAPREAMSLASRPLCGVRVLDLTRIIAGPVAGRALAAHGADVLNVSCGRLPSIPVLVIDTGRGKRTADIDLDTPAGAAVMHDLVRTADVFLQGYRPGGLAGRGFSEEALAQARPGIIVASLSAYGHAGPWAGRRGFDSLTQNANGLNWEEARAASTDGVVDRPKELPAQALDHCAGYLLALGIMIALKRRSEIGGSWRVRTSLAQVGHWLQSLPRVTGGLSARDQTVADVADLLETTPSGFGTLTSVRHAAILSGTPAHWALPAMPLGSHAAEWLPRST